MPATTPPGRALNPSPFIGQCDASFPVWKSKTSTPTSPGRTPKPPANSPRSARLGRVGAAPDPRAPRTVVPPNTGVIGQLCNCRRFSSPVRHSFSSGQGRGPGEGTGPPMSYQRPSPRLRGSVADRIRNAMNLGPSDVESSADSATAGDSPSPKGEGRGEGEQVPPMSYQRPSASVQAFNAHHLPANPLPAWRELLALPVNSPAGSAAWPPSVSPTRRRR